MESKGEETVPSVSVGRPDGARAAWRAMPRPQRQRIGGWIGYVLVVTLLFIQPLTGLMFLAAHSELHSHILLVPFITGYLLYIERGRFPTAYGSSMVGTMVLCGVGVAAAGAGIGWRGSLSVNDHLALMALAFVSLVAAGGFLFLGSKWMASAAFPIAFLIFMVPLPDGAVDSLETASKLASAEAADWFFTMSRTPVLRDRTMFQLPGMVIQVAQECSGIRSSWVLFITSLVASHLFLKSPWRRLLLVASVIPLGILRNGFRIMVIGLLCVHVGPHMIHSPIHHRGGPLFFVLSLIPLFMLLWWLRRGEARRIPPAAPTDAPLPGAPVR